MARFALLTGLLATTIAAAPRSASACGALPTPFVALDATLPAEGDVAVPLDGVIWLTAKGWNPDGSDAETSLAGATLAQHLSVQVREEASGTAVEGSVFSWNGAAWRPSKPLASATRYVAHLTVTNEEPAPDGVTGDTTRTIHFETGSASLDPLAFVGTPSYAFTTTDVERCVELLNNCGTCARTEKSAGRILSITVPGVAGGFAPAGRALQALVTNDGALEEGTVRLSAYALVTDTSTKLEITLPEEKVTYGACMQVELSDATGASLTSMETCLPASEVWGDFVLGAAGSGAEMVDDRTDVAVTTACNMSCQPARATGALTALSIAAMAALRRSRRRRT